MPNELLSVKIEKSKSNYIITWISIGVQFFTTCPSKFLIFVASELLGAKTKESKSNLIPNHIYIHIYIYIYNEKPIHILEIYSYKTKV